MTLNEIEKALNYAEDVGQSELANWAQKHGKKLLALAEGAIKTIEAFQSIDDGFFTGLVPPEMIPICAALIELEKE